MSEDLPLLPNTIEECHEVIRAYHSHFLELKHLLHLTLHRVEKLEIENRQLKARLKLWDGLTRFLEDGRLEIDNNLTEQQIKPFVIARKKFLFCDTVDGAHALCLHFSLIRTAKLHGLDPYHYYVKLLKSIPHCTSVDDYEKLLPWNIKTHLSMTITGN